MVEALALRRQQRAVERLADIDVAEPRDHALVEQRRLQAGVLAPARRAPASRHRMRCRAARARARAAAAPRRASARGTSFIEPNRRGSLKRIVRARRHAEHHMVVRQVLGAVVIIGAGRRHRRSSLLDAERARHAEMHHQHVAGRQVGEQIFGAAAEPGHGLAFEPLREILRQRPAQVAATRLDLDRSARPPSRARARGARFRLREVRAFGRSSCWRALPTARRRRFIPSLLPGL